MKLGLQNYVVISIKNSYIKCNNKKMNMWDFKFSRRRVWCSSLMMEAVRTSETSVDNNLTRQYNPEDSSEQQEDK
jgi:hypothetical protein